ncbi:hypothetical protein PSHT_14310 [Puccinia striiformis]|uniref:Uncharacterized protein n=1 Tax=Puccinia striiformis TaxID=27350 RepID=A0A2S4ULD9_9BASI|nr:hypothetical protein PSHT_14310 [Puccinia striiformis]
MRGPTTYNNFCRFDPKAREILSTREPLKVRCKEVGKLWATIDPETKAEYKDAAYIETIRGDIPMLVTANGSIQTARKTHVAKTTLNLASNQSSITFVKRWAKDTIKRMNEIAACHRIQGFLVIASGKSSGDIFETGGTTLGVSFLNMLIKAGDPLRKLHTYAAGMSVFQELTGDAPVAEQAGIAATPLTQKRKHREIEEPAQERSR